MNSAEKNERRTGLGVKLRDTGVLTREDFDGGPVSLDEIETGLYLGNLTAATHMETLRSFRITHILTLDSIPLPQHIVRASFLNTKYIHIADMPKEDILHRLDECVEFISEALKRNENVLVHCYFGVSRSSSAIIGYLMKQHNLEYQQAYDLLRSKRRFVQPNAGFVTQLKLYQRMGCRIDTQHEKYKIYCLRLACDQMRKAKILPPHFHNIIKTDPAITQENPEPIVYRCRKCRRVVASKSHILWHKDKSVVVNNASTTTTTTTAATTESDANNSTTVRNLEENDIKKNCDVVQKGTTVLPRLLNEIALKMRKTSLGSQAGTSENNNKLCDKILFVEPIAWMKNIGISTQGRLHCPKCEQKLGNFSWINGCQCPCGEEISPAFYLIPSKVELSKTVQNVQTTL